MRQVRLKEVYEGIGYMIEDDLKHLLEGYFLERGHVTCNDEVDGHHIIYFLGKDLLHNNLGVEILGIVHDSDEVLDRLYECAVKYAEGLARSPNTEFINMTERHKQESELEESVSS